MIFLVLLLTHLILCLLHSLTQNRETRFNTIVIKVRRFFTFTVYIRILVEIYMLICLMLVSEFKYYIHIGGDDVFGHVKQSEGEKMDFFLLNEKFSYSLWKNFKHS